MAHAPTLSPWRQHGYGVAGLSFAIVDTAIRIFLFKFLVDEAHLPPALAGTVLLVGKIWDAINDPLVGRLSDRTKTRMGGTTPLDRRGAAALPGVLCGPVVRHALEWSLAGGRVCGAVAPHGHVSHHPRRAVQCTVANPRPQL